MLDLDFGDFNNFLLLDLYLRCHEALINLFPHLHELNIVAIALTPQNIQRTFMQLKSYF